MKRLISILLIAILLLSLSACGNQEAGAASDTDAADREVSNMVVADREVSNMVVADREVTAKDYLIEKLIEFKNSEEFVQAQEEETTMFGIEEPAPLNVTMAFELTLEGYGSQNLTIHLLCVKCNAGYVIDGFGNDNIALVIDYDTGEIYSCFNVDESMMSVDEKSEALYVAAGGGCFVGSDYSGDPIYNSNEVHIPLTDEEIAEVNAAIAE